MIRKKIIRYGILGWIALSIFHGSFVKAADWERMSDDDGIEVFKKELPGDPVVAFKGQGIVDAPIGKVAQILIDTSRARDWVDRLREVRLVRKVSETEYIQYNHFETPVVIKDRDFVVYNRIEVVPQEKTLIVHMKSVQDSLAPVTKYVRGEMINSSFKIKSIENDKKTYVMTEMHLDPKGDVAKWIVNLIQKSWPRNTIEALRKQAAKKDITENLRLKNAILGLNAQ